MFLLATYCNAQRPLMLLKIFDQLWLCCKIFKCSKHKNISSNWVTPQTSHIHSFETWFFFAKILDKIISIFEIVLLFLEKFEFNWKDSSKTGQHYFQKQNLKLKANFHRLLEPQHWSVSFFEFLTLIIHFNVEVEL